MPQLDINLFLNSFSSIVIFLFLFYLYLIIYVIPKIFKSLTIRNFIRLFYKKKNIKISFDLRYNKLLFLDFLVKIIRLRK